MDRANLFEMVWALAPQTSLQILEVKKVPHVAYEPVSSKNRAQERFDVSAALFHDTIRRDNHAVGPAIGVSRRKILQDRKSGFLEFGGMILAVGDQPGVNSPFAETR
jgi:hypothetical protein